MAAPHFPSGSQEAGARRQEGKALRTGAWIGCGLFLSVLLGAVPAFAGGTGAALYNEGNALYRAGKYAQAIERYEMVLLQGVENGYVYYNLGNAYFKDGQIGRAVLAYERALRLMPGDEDVRANLRFVNAVKADREPEDEANVLTRLLRAVYRGLSADGLAAFCSLCLFGLAGAGVGWLFRPGRRTVWIVLLVAMGMGLCGSGAVLAFKVHEREVARQAVILGEQVVGRSGPGEDFLQVFTVHEGTRVVIERAEKGWLLIRLPNGIGGWAPQEAMEEI